MEKREPSVRELFRTASRLARTFVLRPERHAAHAHAAHPAAATAAMARTSSGGSGVVARRRSVDAAAGMRPGSSLWPDGSRPASPVTDPGV